MPDFVIKPPAATRRGIVFAGAGAALGAGLALDVVSAQAGPRPLKSPATTRGHDLMTTFTAKDGAKIYFKDWGEGQPIVFCHGWPLDADAWDAQMLFLVQHGYRVIAHDRRGHGRSDQTSGGNDMDTYADDVATLISNLGLRKAMMVGHSTGGGEVARYIGRHGTNHLSKAVLIGAVTPTMLVTNHNPSGTPMSVFDGLRAGMSSDRSSFFRDLALPFFGYNKPDAKPSQGVIDSFWSQGMLGGIKGQFECIKAFSETDFTEDLAKMTIPTLLLHGDADQIVPINDASVRAAKMLPLPTLKVYPGAPHGMCVTRAPEVNADLLAFLKT